MSGALILMAMSVVPIGAVVASAKGARGGILDRGRKQAPGTGRRHVVVVGRGADDLVAALARGVDADVEGWRAGLGGERFAAGAPTELIVAAVRRCTSSEVVVVVNDREVDVLEVASPSPTFMAAPSTTPGEIFLG